MKGNMRFYWGFEDFQSAWGKFLPVEHGRDRQGAPLGRRKLCEPLRPWEKV